VNGSAVRLRGHSGDPGDLVAATPLPLSLSSSFIKGSSSLINVLHQGPSISIKTSLVGVHLWLPLLGSAISAVQRFCCCCSDYGDSGDHARFRGPRQSRFGLLGWDSGDLKGGGHPPVRPRSSPVVPGVSRPRPGGRPGRSRPCPDLSQSRPNVGWFFLSSETLSTGCCLSKSCTLPPPEEL
jgi:hypothetical protein